MKNIHILPEVIKQYCLQKHGQGYYPDIEKGIEFGAKWQQERMYSEEEVLRLLNKREEYMNSEDDILEYKSINQWFEQFKKK